MENANNSNKKSQSMISPAGDQRLCHDGGLISYKLEEQHKLIEQLKMTLKGSEDKRKVLETRGKNLLAENRKLKNLLDMEHTKFVELQKKRVHERMIKIRDGYQRAPRRKESSSEKLKTLSKPLIAVKESSTQTALSKECRHCSERRQQGVRSVADFNLEAGKAEEDLHQLKELLNKREQTWTKIAERDRELRERITMLTTELSSVRQIASTRNDDLHKTTMALKTTKDELFKAKKELLLLKQLTKRLKNQERALAAAKTKESQPEEPPPVEEKEKVAMFHK